MKTLLISCFCILAACARVAGFPSEEEMKARLRLDMTVEEVISAFGQPTTGVGQLSGPSQLRYIAPIGSMTAEKQGFIGFEIQLVDGRVRGWRTYLGNPSYEPMKPPRELRRVGRLWLVIFGGVFVYALVRAFQRWMSEEQTMLKAYMARDIPTPQLPIEFRFINNDTTLQEIIDKVGPYSRLRKHPVSRSFASGCGLSSEPFRTPTIDLIEYDLPYHAAVILMPEHPFQPENRIRAAFYRRPRPDEEA